jgi:hypothetical protein
MYIHEEAEHGNLEYVQDLLISNPELVNALNQWQNTPPLFRCIALKEIKKCRKKTCITN